MYEFSTLLYKIELKKNTTALIVIDLVAFCPLTGMSYFYRISNCFARNLDGIFRIGPEDTIVFGSNCGSCHIHMDYCVDYKYIYVYAKNSYETEWHKSISISSPRGKFVLHENFYNK